MMTRTMTRFAGVAAAFLFSGFFQPAPAQTATAQPRGVYASIDMRPAQELVRRLGAAGSGERRAAVHEVLKDPSAQMPPVLYALANALSGEPSHGEESVFWYHVGRLRAVYDARRCRDESALGVVGALGKKLSADLIALQFYQRERLLPIATKAVEWDSANPRAYDQRWACLEGDVAAKSPGTDPGEVNVPESEWPAMLKHIHEAHLKAVTDFANEKKGR